MSLELGLRPIIHLIRQKGSFRSQRGMGCVRSISRVVTDSGRGGKLVLVERWRLVRRAGLRSIGLKEVRRGSRRMRPRRRHAIDIVGVQRRLLEERCVILISLTRWEEGEVAVVEIGRQIVGLRLGIEVSARCRELLVEVGARVEEVVGVRDVLLAEQGRLLEVVVAEGVEVGVGSSRE